MKFDFSYDKVLQLKFTFVEQDHENFFRSFVEFGSQLSSDKKQTLWNERKLHLVHDFITTYLDMESARVIQDEDYIFKIHVEVNDRGSVVKFRVFPGWHVQDIAACKEYQQCKVLDFLTKKEKAFLCDRCGKFDVDKCTYCF